MIMMVLLLVVITTGSMMFTIVFVIGVTVVFGCAVLVG